MKTIFRTLLKSTPIIGEVIDNVQTNNGTKIGTINVKQLGFMIIRIILTIALIKGILTTKEVLLLW